MATVTNMRVRDAMLFDHAMVVTVLTNAFRDGAVAQWAERHATVRSDYLRAYFTALIAHAGQHGVIRIADIGNRIGGVALWYRYPLADTVLDVHEVDTPSLDVNGHLVDLEEALAERHPAAVPHWYLAYLGVRPDTQNQGVGTTLLTDQPEREQLPAYLEANDPRNRSLYARLGFLDHGRPVTSHGGPPVFPMWRPAATC